MDRAAPDVEAEYVLLGRRGPTRGAIAAWIFWSLLTASLVAGAVAVCAAYPQSRPVVLTLTGLWILAAPALTFMTRRAPVVRVEVTRTALRRVECFPGRSRVRARAWPDVRGIGLSADTGQVTVRTRRGSWRVAYGGTEDQRRALQHALQRHLARAGGQQAPPVPGGWVLREPGTDHALLLHPEPIDRPMALLWLVAGTSLLLIVSSTEVEHPTLLRADLEILGVSIGGLGAFIAGLRLLAGLTLRVEPALLLHPRGLRHGQINIRTGVWKDGPHPVERVVLDLDPESDGDPRLAVVTAAGDLEKIMTAPVHASVGDVAA